MIIKEQRSELVKHHLWVLWTDYFKPPHFEKYPQLHQLFNEATKLAGAAGTKGSSDVGHGGRAAGQDRRDRQDLLGDQAGLSPGPAWPRPPSSPDWPAVGWAVRSCSFAPGRPARAARPPRGASVLTPSGR